MNDLKVCVHCGAAYDPKEAQRTRCPACKRPHADGSYSQLCGSQWCRCCS